MFTIPNSRSHQSQHGHSFHDLERILDTMNHTFSLLRDDHETEGTMPINIWTTPDGLVVNAEVPGVDPAQVSVSVLDNNLTIHGRKADDSSSLTRAITLPYRADSEHTEARCQNGLLTIVLRRLEADKPRRITVQAA